jgi:hypothetical protein
MANSKKFKQEKQKMINATSKFIEAYEKFTKSVAPKHRRMTGNHFMTLGSLLATISVFDEITEDSV